MLSDLHLEFNSGIGKPQRFIIDLQSATLYPLLLSVSMYAN